MPRLKGMRCTLYNILGPHFFSPVHAIVARTALLLRAAEIKTRAPHTSDARGAAVQTRRRAAIQTQWRAAAYLWDNYALLRKAHI